MAVSSNTPILSRRTAVARLSASAIGALSVAATAAPGHGATLPGTPSAIAERGRAWWTRQHEVDRLFARLSEICHSVGPTPEVPDVLRESICGFYPGPNRSHIWTAEQLLGLADHAYNDAEAISARVAEVLPIRREYDRARAAHDAAYAPFAVEVDQSEELVNDLAHRNYLDCIAIVTTPSERLSDLAVKAAIVEKQVLTESDTDEALAALAFLFAEVRALASEGTA